MQEKSWYLIYTESEFTPRTMGSNPPRLKVVNWEEVIQEAEEELLLQGVERELSDFLRFDESTPESDKNLVRLVVSIKILVDTRRVFIPFDMTEEGAKKFVHISKRYGLEQQARALVEEYKPEPSKNPFKRLLTLFKKKHKFYA